MSLAEKADRLAREGKVVDLYSTGDLLSATVQGDTDTYKVTRDPNGWNCSCPAFQLGHKMCSHIGAAGLVEKYGPIYEAERKARRRLARRVT